MKYDLTFLELELRELLKKLKKHNTYANQLENEIILYNLENNKLKSIVNKATRHIEILLELALEQDSENVNLIDRLKGILDILKGVDKE